MCKGVKRNIKKVIQGIPNEKYRNIIKRKYEKPTKCVSKNKTRKRPKNNNL
jgi:hypothetical protein